MREQAGEGGSRGREETRVSGRSTQGSLQLRTALCLGPLPQVTPPKLRRGPHHGACRGLSAGTHPCFLLFAQSFNKCPKPVMCARRHATAFIRVALSTPTDVLREGERLAQGHTVREWSGDLNLGKSHAKAPKPIFLKFYPFRGLAPTGKHSATSSVT